MEDKKLEEALKIARLINNKLQGDLCEQDQAFLINWIQSSSANQIIYEELMNAENLKETILHLEQYDTEFYGRRIFDQLELPWVETAKQKPGHLSFIKTALFKWAAAACFFFMVGYGGFYWFSHQYHKSTASLVKSIVPGSSKAILTLADGSTVILDSAHHGSIGKQGEVSIVNVQNGLIAYKGASADITPPLNTMTIPKGGEFQLVLSDGTKVRLNSASSLQYPVAFVGKQREVRLSGEAYFEVAKNKNMPFIVSVNGMQVRVLGTHFNIKAYPDEKNIRTTLIEGSVKVSDAGKEVLITPGQQAVLNNTDHSLHVRQANLDEVLAWTKGEFLFENTNIQSIMRQVSRWYNAEIIFDTDLSSIRFSGGMRREQNIQQLLEILETDGRLQFEIKGQSIIVHKHN